jgi:hypothetical protein
MEKRGAYGISELPSKRRLHLKNRIVISAIILVGVFFVSFVPQYVKARRLENELQQARRENDGAKLRDLAGLAYFHADQKNYGLAAATAMQLFSKAREVANQTQAANARKVLEDVISLRDKITTELAKGDAAVMSDLQEVFTKTRQATVGAP